MKILSQFIISGLFAICAPNSTYAGESHGFSKYVESIPGIGLISDTIEFDGITISDFLLENGKKYIFCEGNQEVNIRFNYEINSSKLETLHLNHLIIGLYDDGPQKCVLSTLGITDSKGTAEITLVAPEKAGAYQVRFCLSEGLTDERAMKAWWRGEGPSAKTIMGIFIVK